MTTYFIGSPPPPQHQIIYVQAPGPILAPANPVMQRGHFQHGLPLDAEPMQLLWHAEFDRLFGQFYQFWCLFPKMFCEPRPFWHTHSDSAKVRFLCQDCGHGWTSMKGRVVFWYHLDPCVGHGAVAFELFGQKCEKCTSVDEACENYTAAMWYPEEVAKVLSNIFNKVGQTYYGFERPTFTKTRRPGKPRSQHCAKLCQACRMGVCTVQMQPNSDSGSGSGLGSDSQENRSRTSTLSETDEDEPRVVVDTERLGVKCYTPV